jgi:protein kinase A
VRSFQDDEFLSLVMEYIEDARPLYQCIWRYKTARVFPERVAKYFTVQLVLAVEAIHAAGFLHRDLKSGNVLVDKRGIARVIDYGFAKRLDDGETDSQSMRTFSVCGTHYIMAPEMFLRQPYAGEVDWWCVLQIIIDLDPL